MKILIDIDEKIYKQILPYKDVPVISNLANYSPELTHAIANGIPLSDDDCGEVTECKYYTTTP